MLVCQSVYPINNPLNHYKIPFNHHKSPLNPRGYSPSGIKCSDPNRLTPCGEFLSQLPSRLQTQAGDLAARAKPERKTREDGGKPLENIGKPWDNGLNQKKHGKTMGT